MENNIINNTKEAECLRCGKCCANVLLLTPMEIQSIKKHIKKNNVQPTNRNSIMLFSSQGYVDCCPFLTKENLCAIYTVRPKICKEFKCSSFCDLTDNNQTDYKNVKATNMMKTFFPEEYCPYDDSNLDVINEKINNLNKKIYNRK